MPATPGKKASPREEMLSRIRHALGRALVDPATVDEGPSLPPIGEVMPPIEPGDELAKFEDEFVKVGGHAHRAESLAALASILEAILDSAGATEVVLSRNPLLCDLALGAALETKGRFVTWWPALPGREPSASEAAQFRERCFAAGVGITGVDVVLAETGSLLVSSRTEGSQLASLAPPVHVALYRRDQLVGSLEEALERVPAARAAEDDSPGRSVVFITGSSRTADIEQILVRGVHGPREVHAVLVEEACFRRPGHEEGI
jgi:L-lactate dehydrogenase complex protein LldG